MAKSFKQGYQVGVTVDKRICDKLEKALTMRQRAVLKDSYKLAAWNHVGPQREEYSTPEAYVAALGRYADAIDPGWRRLIITRG